MKSYFRSLKRSKSKNIDEQKQGRATGKYRPSGLTYDRGFANEVKRHEQEKQNKGNETWTDNVGGDVNLPQIESTLSKQEAPTNAYETNASDFNTSSFWREPFMKVDLECMAEDESKVANNILQVEEANNLDVSQLQFTAVAFWKDPMPDIDFSTNSEVMTNDENSKAHNIDIECNEKQQKEKLIPDSPEFEEEFSSAQFWKDPIPDICLGDLMNIEEANRDVTVPGFMKSSKKNPKADILLENAAKIVSNSEDIPKKIEILEDSYKCLRFDLQNVKHEILKLEDRVKHLERS